MNQPLKLGDSWPGRGDHEGHTITLRSMIAYDPEVSEDEPPPPPEADMLDVVCSCGKEWIAIDDGWWD